MIIPSTNISRMGWRYSTHSITSSHSPTPWTISNMSTWYSETCVNTIFSISILKNLLNGRGLRRTKWDSGRCGVVLPWLGWKPIKQPSLSLALQKLSVSQSRNIPAVGKPTFSRSWLWAGFEPAHALIKPPMWQWLCFLMKSFWGSSSHMELCVYNHIYWVWGLCFMVHIKIHFWY